MLSNKCDDLDLEALTFAVALLQCLLPFLAFSLGSHIYFPLIHPCVIWFLSLDDKSQEDDDKIIIVSCCCAWRLKEAKKHSLLRCNFQTHKISPPLTIFISGTNLIWTTHIELIYRGGGELFLFTFTYLCPFISLPSNLHYYCCCCCCYSFLLLPFLQAQIKTVWTCAK